MKHSRFELRGRRRIHQAPDQAHVTACPGAGGQRRRGVRGAVADLTVVARALAA